MIGVHRAAENRLQTGDVARRRLDERVYIPAAEMLRQLGFGMVRLLTNNPDKVVALERYGIRVAERVPHVFPSNGYNERDLCTKATRSGHFL